jgi:hypothetical protein
VGSPQSASSAGELLPHVLTSSYARAYSDPARCGGGGDAYAAGSAIPNGVMFRQRASKPAWNSPGSHANGSLKRLHAAIVCAPWVPSTERSASTCSPTCLPQSAPAATPASPAPPAAAISFASAASSAPSETGGWSARRAPRSTACAAAAAAASPSPLTGAPAGATRARVRPRRRARSMPLTASYMATVTIA